MENSPLFIHDVTEKGLGSLGGELAGRLRPGDVLLLEGPLGSGKTVLARAIIRALSGQPTLDVPSPSFSLRQDYRAAKSKAIIIRHFDLYRLKDEAELEALEIDDGQGLSIDLIEWPDRLGDRTPVDALRIELNLADERGKRRVMLTGRADWRDRLAGLDALESVT